jgi:hypothetical protein
MDSGSSVIKTDSEKGWPGKSNGASGSSSSVGVEAGAAAVDVQLEDMVTEERSELSSIRVWKLATAWGLDVELAAGVPCAVCKLDGLRY